MDTTLVRPRRVPERERDWKDKEIESNASSRTHFHLFSALFAPIFIHFVPGPTPLCFPPPPLPLQLPCLLAPSLSLLLACTSSGHGSLSQLQRGCVGTGYLSYCPAPSALLKTQIHRNTCMSTTTDAHRNALFSFFSFAYVAFSLTQM